MKKVLRWSVPALIALAVVAAIVLALRPQPVPVDVEEVTEGPMRLTIDEEGKTRIRERYVVSSPLMGRLRRITLDAGDAVRAEDTVLAVIEPTDPALLDARALAEAEGRVRAAEAAVRLAGAQLENARAGHEFADNELSRIVAASEQDAVSSRELDLAVTAERRAAEELRAAESAQEIAEFELDVAESALLYARGEEGEADQSQMVLRSPIDGAVLRVFQESVAVVTSGTPLLEVGDPRDLEIVVDVLSVDAVKIHPGDRVIIDHWGGNAPLEGVVRLVEPSGFTKISALGIEEQRVNVIVDFVTPAAQRETLGDAFRVEAGIVVWEDPDVLRLPTSAAFRDGEQWAVYAVNFGKAVLRHVEIGHQNGRVTEVLNGLNAGDEVIVHPNDQLAEGVRVEARE